ncbi:MAG: T9SS type A sorting domain-containing protein [Chitinophagales bacterium]
MIFTFSIETYAQCYTACTGGGALPSYSVTTTTTFAAGTYKMSSNLSITSSGGSYGNLTISNSCIEVDNASLGIVINNGCTLTVSNSTIYCSASTLWKGIKITGGGTLILQSNTKIADADKAVYANSGTSEAKFTISGTTFCNNKYGIFASPYTSSTTIASTVTDSTFTGGSLLGGGNSIAGIYLSGFGTSTNIFTIGSLGVYGTSTNYFTGSDKGIYAEDSYIYVEDGDFHDMASGGYGIFSKSTASPEDVLRVGTISGSGTNNKFNNCETAVNVSSNVKTYIWENEFTSSYGTGSGPYTMQKAVKIETSTSGIEIKDNTINNYEDHGVWLKDVTGASTLVNIYGNTFNLTSSFTSASTAMAIRVFETTPGELTLEIYDNVINEGKTGIHINGVESPDGSNFVIHDNEVYFSPYGTSDNAHGIQVIHGYNNRVFSNYCEGNGAGTADRIRGIYFDDTQWFNCTSNHVYNCSVGIYCNADVSLSLINCNMIEDCPYAGMFFNNIGGSSTVQPLYPNMTATGAPAGNYWLPDPTANRGASNGTTNFAAQSWYFSDDDGTQYTMPNPCFVGVTYPLVPTDITGGNECVDIPYARTSGDEETDDIIEELVRAYGTYAYVFDNHYPDGTLNDFYTLYSFWEKVNSNDIDADILPDILIHLFDFVAETNIPELLILSNAISAHDYDSATTLLETISPENDIEYYITRTSEIYLNNLNDEGVFELNDEILPEIRSIAVLNGWDYGRGIYTARAMMDTVIEFNMPEEEEKLGIISEQKIVIYPNPASHIISFKNAKGQPISGIYSIEVCNLLGIAIKSITSSLNQIDVSDLADGIYFIKIKSLDGIEYSVKLEILK